MQDFLVTPKARINLCEIKDKTLDVLFNQQFPGHNISGSCANGFVYNYKSQRYAAQNSLF